MVDDVEQGDWEDPAVLENLRDLAVRVSFTEGESKVQDLSNGHEVAGFRQYR